MSKKLNHVQMTKTKYNAAVQYKHIHICCILLDSYGNME